MTHPNEPLPRSRPEASGPATQIAAMRDHVSHLESELASTVAQLNTMESRASDIERRATQAIKDEDYDGARHAILELNTNWEAFDEEAGILKADIRVLRVLLAECREWLEARGNGSPPTSESPQTGP